MNTRRKLALLALLAVVLVASILVAFVTHLNKPARILSPGETLPERDIVFMVNPIDIRSTESVLGFINSDGSGYTTRKVELPNWRRWRPFTLSPDLARSGVVWGPSGYYLIGRYSVSNLSSGIPLLIYTDGTFVKCPDDETSPYAEGRSWGISENTILTVLYRGLKEPDKLVVVDMTDDCKVVSVVYTAATDEILREATISSQQRLAVSRWFHQRDEVAIMKPDSTVIAALPEAVYPTWSPDGEWLAYSIYDDGLYVIRKDGTDVRKLAEAHLFLAPSWSPDGQWLVYSRDQVIYKFNVAKGEEYELFKGGYNPDWRWVMSIPNQD
jgi:hypothetical protein